MAFVTSLALGLATLQVAIASPVAESLPLITPSPVLQRRDYAPNFVGYVLVNNIVQTLTCNSPLTYTYYNGYAGCVRGTSYLGSRCNGYYITYYDGATASCNGYCVTDAVYYSTDDTNPASMVGCASQPTGLEILRTSVGGSSGVASVKFTPAPVPSPNPTTPVLSTPSSPATTPTAASTAASTAPPLTAQASPAKKSIGPIIGGAVGGVLILIGLVALGLFIFLRKRERKPAFQAGGFGADQPAVAPMAPVAPTGPHPPNPAMSQAYAAPVVSPMQSPAISPITTYQPVSPAPYTPLPAYGQEKTPSVTMASIPVQNTQAEYRVPDGVAEMHGVSSTVQPNQAPRNGASELA